jgi:hypothetical protein
MRDTRRPKRYESQNNSVHSFSWPAARSCDISAHGLHWVARFSVHGSFRERKRCSHLSLELFSTETLPHGTSPSLVESHFISTKEELWITSLSIREILVHMTRTMASAVFPMYCNTEPRVAEISMRCLPTDLPQGKIIVL